MAFLKNIYNMAALLGACLAPLLLTGCYQAFEPDLESTPVVCVNSRATAGEVLEVTVSRTWRWSEGTPETIDIYLPDADVRLYINGSFREQLHYTEEAAADRPDFDWSDPHRIMKFYRGTYVARSGDHIRITVDDPAYGHAEGEVTVPFPVEIEKVDAMVSNLSLTGEGEEIVWARGNAALNVWFSDPAETENYYEFDTGTGIDHSKPSLVCDFYTDFSFEPLFTEHVSPLESIMSETWGYCFFTDRQIAGKKYPLHLRLENFNFSYYAAEGPSGNAATVNLTLYSISESYWRHVISVWESNDGINGTLGDIGLADPIWEVSNVSTGAGVISARARSVCRLPFSTLLERRS